MTGDVIRGFRCPECGEESLTYNGNYYCLNGQCWAMETDVPIMKQPTWELQLMIAYMDATNREGYAIYTGPLKDELARRAVEVTD